MKRILVTGASGQIGTELLELLRKNYGQNQVIASDIKPMNKDIITSDGPFEIIDVTDAKKISQIVKKYKADTIIHLASLLSAVAEGNPTLAWQINMGGLFNVLEVARQDRCSVFIPSSIAAFGPLTPADKTPQDTIQRPDTMYGVTKVSGEILCDYYHKKYGVDTRGVRFPGLISHGALPGGGTTDYAVHIYYDAIKNKTFECNIKKGTYMDMMYMPDALDAIVKLMEADPIKLKHRNAFNITAMQFDPELIYKEIKKHIPNFKMEYKVDMLKQSIADSWPNSIDASAAIEEWGFSPSYDLALMTKDMLNKLSKKIK